MCCDDCFNVTRLNHEGVVVLRCVGELDLVGAGILRHEIRSGVTAGPVVVDASGVSFIDCAGLSALIAGTHAGTSAGRPVVLAAPSVRVLRLLDATQTLDRFAVHSCVASAVRACRAAVLPA